MGKKSRIAVYSDRNVGTPISVLEGFRSLGFNALHRATNVYKRGETEDFEVVVVTGMHNNNRLILEDYEAKGIPVIVYDMGRVRSSEFNHVYLGFGGLDWMPKSIVDGKRLKKIGFTGVSHLAGGDNILVLGQVPDDQSHGMPLKALDAFYNKIIDDIFNLSDRDIIFRPHPLSIHKHNIKGAEIRANEQEDLADALQETFAVVCINSTAGIQALRSGVPVFCDDKSFLASVSHTDIAGIDNPIEVDEKDVEEFFKKLSYTQWSIKEIVSGEAIEFLLNDLDLEIPEVVAKTLPPVPTVEEAEQAAADGLEENKDDEDTNDDPESTETASNPTEETPEETDGDQSDDDSGEDDADGISSDADDLTPTDADNTADIKPADVFGTPDDADDQSDAADSGTTENGSEGSEDDQGSDAPSTDDAAAMEPTENGSGDGSDDVEPAAVEKAGEKVANATKSGAVVNVKKKKAPAKKKTPAKKAKK